MAAYIMSWRHDGKQWIVTINGEVYARHANLLIAKWRAAQNWKDGKR